MASNYEKAGTWWNDSSIELVKIGNEVYALNDWNGEEYTSCWKCTGEYNNIESKEEYVITPLYEQMTEDEYEIIGYRIEVE